MAAVDACPVPADGCAKAVVGYNCLSLMQPFRLQFLLYMMSWSMVIGLSGTRMPWNGRKVEEFHQDGFYCLSGGARCNKASGVMLCFNESILPQKSLRFIAVPPTNLQGRCLAVRAKLQRFDVFFVVSYQQWSTSDHKSSAFSMHSSWFQSFSCAVVQ